MKHRTLLLVMALFCLLAACGPTTSEPTSSAPALYIQNSGSDTLVNLALAWAERYQQEHPEVSISVTGGGTGTGIAALINKTIDIANASRSMKDEEIQQAQAAGFEPVKVVVALDAIAVIINPENPVENLTLQQISDIYSGKINNWLEVGGDDRPIVCLSRETNSGTHVYFLETVIRLGDKKNPTLFATETLLLPSSEGIINEVRLNPNAIGYDGLGYVPTDGSVKVVGLSKDPAGPFILPSVTTVTDKTYPVARALYMYTAGEPTGVIKEYLDWILSVEAQQIVSELGFVPVK